MADTITKTAPEPSQARPRLSREGLVSKHFLYEVETLPSGTVPFLLYGEVMEGDHLLATDPTSGEPFEIHDRDLPNVREIVNDHTAELLVEYGVSTFNCKLNDFFTDIEVAVRDSRVMAPWLKRGRRRAT